jgi:hypothetical protein
MKFNFKFYLFLATILCLNIGFSQEKPIIQDTTQVYKKIEDYSKKSKFTTFLHKLIFEPSKIKTSNPIRKREPKDYTKYNGKIIRNINIQTLDPFGYAVSDTTKEVGNWAERFGNQIHIKTSQLAVKNLLLFRRNKPLDPLAIKESERLIRQQRFVREVQFRTEPIPQNADSVDIYIRVLDSWSLIPKGSISSSRTSIGFHERNFLGTGHDFNNKITKRLTDGKNAYRMKYEIPNIKNTYIKTSVAYQIDLNDNYGKSLNIDRIFYSPLTRWAGGVYIDEQFRTDSLQNEQLQYNPQNFKFNSQDFWGGYSFPIFKGKTERERTSNLIFSARSLYVHYKESPTVEYDRINFFSGETFYLGGIGITSRQFVEDQYLFYYGIIEDVPVGKIYGITGGYQIKNNQERFYLGARASFGNYFKWGYLSTNFEYGTFLRDKKTEQSAFSFQANYFTNLVEIGRWKMRQFIKPQIIIGVNRLESVGDKLTINESTIFQGINGAGIRGENSAGIRGFDSAVYGTEKFVLSLQSQFYSPRNIIGFRLNPFFNFSAAMLGNEEAGLTKSKLYSSFGIGVLINNDYLVFNTFQLSFSFYPTIPGQGNNIFKSNSFETTDFGFQEFNFGKPRPVIFK